MLSGESIVRPSCSPPRLKSSSLRLRRLRRRNPCHSSRSSSSSLFVPCSRTSSSLDWRRLLSAKRASLSRPSAPLCAAPACGLNVGDFTSLSPPALRLPHREEMLFFPLPLGAPAIAAVVLLPGADIESMLLLPSVVPGAETMSPGAETMSPGAETMSPGAETMSDPPPYPP